MVTDLSEALVPSAAGVPAPIAAETRIFKYPITVKDYERDNKRPLPGLPTPHLAVAYFVFPLFFIFRTPRLSLMQKKVAVFVDKVAKRERKQLQKKTPRNKRFCKICQISRNSAIVFHDHISPCSHRIQV